MLPLSLLLSAGLWTSLPGPVPRDTCVPRQLSVLSSSKNCSRPRGWGGHTCRFTDLCYVRGKGWASTTQLTFPSLALGMRARPGGDFTQDRVRPLSEPATAAGSVDVEETPTALFAVHSDNLYHYLFDDIAALAAMLRYHGLWGWADSSKRLTLGFDNRIILKPCAGTKCRHRRVQLVQAFSARRVVFFEQLRELPAPVFCFSTLVVGASIQSDRHGGGPDGPREFIHTLATHLGLGARARRAWQPRVVPSTEPPPPPPMGAPHGHGVGGRTEPWSVLVVQRLGDYRRLDNPFAVARHLTFSPSSRAAAHVAGAGDGSVGSAAAAAAARAALGPAGVTSSVAAFEGASFREHARAMLDSDAVFAVHGAALSHLVFMRPGSCVVEMAPISTWYHTLTKQFSMRHRTWPPEPELVPEPEPEEATATTMEKKRKKKRGAATLFFSYETRGRGTKALPPCPSRGKDKVLGEDDLLSDRCRGKGAKPCICAVKNHNFRVDWLDRLRGTIYACMADRQRVQDGLARERWQQVEKRRASDAQRIKFGMEPHATPLAFKTY